MFSRQSEAGPSRLAIQAKRSLPPTIRFNQVFPSPIGSHLSALDNAQVVQENPSADYTSQSRASEAVESVLQGRSQDASTDHAAADEKEALTLDNLVEGFLSRQKELADASGGRQIPTANQEEIVREHRFRQNHRTDGFLFAIRHSTKRDYPSMRSAKPQMDRSLALCHHLRSPVYPILRPKMSRIAIGQMRPSRGERHCANRFSSKIAIVTRTMRTRWNKRSKADLRPLWTRRSLQYLSKHTRRLPSQLQQACQDPLALLQRSSPKRRRRSLQSRSHGARHCRVVNQSRYSRRVRGKSRYRLTNRCHYPRTHLLRLPKPLEVSTFLYPQSRLGESLSRGQCQ